jgi:hypothetical protein
MNPYGKPYEMCGLNRLLQNIRALSEAQLSAYIDKEVRQAVRRPRPKPTTDQEEIYELGLLKDEDFKRILTSLVQDLIAGDKTAMPQIIAFCFGNEREVPELAKAFFTEACRSIDAYESRSWDDVFGVKLKKGGQIEAARRRKFLGFEVWSAVEERQAAGEPISKDMFDAIAERLEYGGKPIGGTLASEAYREFKKRFKGFVK